MKTKLAATLSIAMLLLGFLAVFPVRSTLPTSLSVVPSVINYTSATLPPGGTFTVDIVADVVAPDAFFGWEFVLAFDPTVITCTGESLNLGIWGAGNFLGPWVPVPIDNVAGTYHQSVTGKAPGVAQSGTFTLVTLTFTAMAPGPGFGETIISVLDLQKATGYTAYGLLDASSNEIEHSWNDGTLNWSFAMITEFPHLEVSPASKIISGANIAVTPVSVSFDVVVKEVLAGGMLAGVEFILEYNDTVLELTGVTEGGFFAAFTPVTYFQWWDLGIDAVTGLRMIRVVNTVLDVPNYTPASGEGVIATFDFNAILQEQFPTVVTSPLNLSVDTGNGMTSYFVMINGEEMSYDPAVNGLYQMNGFILGRVIDLFDQYPAPYGGQGPFAPSDMFWPQKEIQLFANVTYNNWPVQNKLVSFEVRDPAGNLVDILTAVSDTVGTATTSYRIPWPCDNPEALFGVWTITATVDIACIVVNDSMSFHFDYLVHWYNPDEVIKVTTDKDSYKHSENILTTVTFGTHRQQEMDVLLTVSVHDELNYPIGTAFAVVRIVATEMGNYCFLTNYTVTLPIHVVKWTAAGVATIYVNAYSDWPALGGSPLAPTYEPAPTVNILAEWA